MLDMSIIRYLNSTVGAQPSPSKRMFPAGCAAVASPHGAAKTSAAPAVRVGCPDREYRELRSSMVSCKYQCGIIAAAALLFTLASTMQPHEQQSVDLVLWDTEQTAWEGSNGRRWMGTIPGSSRRETREIIQLSALRATLHPPTGGHHPSRPSGWSLKRLEGSLHVVVKPRINPQLSRYVTDLTNITQAEVDTKGVSLAEALRQLHRFSDGAALFSYGNDWTIVADNLALVSEASPKPNWARDMFDVKPIFRAAGLNLTGQTSGTVLRTVGLSPQGHVHNALWDCTSMLLALQRVLDRSYSPPREAHAGAAQPSVDQQRSVGHVLRHVIASRRETDTEAPLVPRTNRSETQLPARAAARTLLV